MPDYGNLGTPGSYNINRYAADNYSYLGDDYSFIQKTLKNNLATGMPGLTEQRSLALRDINRGVTDARRQMTEQMASLGNYGSPVGLNLVNDLYGKKADAIGTMDVDLLQKNAAYKNAILSQLQGLNQFGAQQKLGETQANMNLAWRDKEFKEQQRQYNKSQETDFWNDTFPSLLGNAAKVAATYASGGTQTDMNNYNDIFGIQ